MIPYEMLRFRVQHLCTVVVVELVDGVDLDPRISPS